MNNHLLILLSSSFLLACFSSAATLCNPDDNKVLMQIKTALNNPNLLSSWRPNTDCCTWYGIQCAPTTNTDRVYSLTISSRTISTQIPSAVGDLPYLETLIFRKLSVLTRTIPQSISKLKRLRLLELSRANLIGPIPNFLSELPNLNYVDLSFNRLSGTIPPSLSKLTRLYGLQFSYNNLTGSIPDSFGQFTGLVPDLRFSHNQLSGRIPDSLGHLDYDIIELSRNKLVGDASMLFRVNGTGREMYLSRNMLEFDLSKVEFQKSLKSLDLSNNKVYGSIPKEITGLENLKMFNVSYNRLCGEIPSGGKLQDFDSSSYIHNSCLCGPPLIKCK